MDQKKINALNERITASALMKQIHSYKDGYVYYNSCCNREEERENRTSYQGSNLERDAGTIKDSQNSTEAWIDNWAANTAVPAFSQGLNEVFIQRQVLLLRSLNGKNNRELKAVFQQPDAASERAIVDAQATQLLRETGSVIHADRFNIENTLMWPTQKGHEGVVLLRL